MMDCLNVKYYAICNTCGERIEVDNSICLTSYPLQYGAYCHNCETMNYIKADKCFVILSDVSKPKNENFTVEISLIGCHETTSFNIKCTYKEFEFLKKIANKSIHVSKYECMPTMKVKNKTIDTD